MLKLTILLILMTVGGFAREPEQCDYGPTPCEAYEKADAVFIGTVKRIIPQTTRSWQTEDDYDQSAYILIDKVYKGRVGSQIVLRQLGRRHAKKFVLASRYLFYANYEAKLKLWEVRPCGRTRMAAYAQDDQHYLTKLKGTASSPPQRSRVAGEVTIYTPDPDIQGRTERLSGMRVKITGEGKEYEARTDENGIYELYDLPAGRYTVRPVLASGLMLMAAIHYGRDIRSRIHSFEIEVIDGGCSGVSFILTEEPKLKGDEKPLTGKTPAQPLNHRVSFATGKS